MRDILAPSYRLPGELCKNSDAYRNDGHQNSSICNLQQRLHSCQTRLCLFVQGNDDQTFRVPWVAATSFNSFAACIKIYKVW